MNLIAFIRIAIVIYFCTTVGVLESRADMDGDLLRALDEWSRAKHVALARDVRFDLIVQARAAVNSVHKGSPSLSIEKLEQLIPRTVVSFLNDTQIDPNPRNLAKLLEDAASNKIFGEVGAFGPFVAYPVLKIVVTPVTPSDFVVAVDGELYPAGVTAVRVKAGERAVVVTRANKPKCAKIISVTDAGPNQVDCAM